MAAAADVQHLVTTEETIDLIGNKPLIPGAPYGIDAGFPGRTGGLTAQAFPGVGQSGPGEQSARPRHGAAGQVDRGGTFPFGLEQWPHALDRCRNARHQMDAVFRVAEGEGQSVGELPGAPVAQQQAPCVERAGHDGRQQPGTRDQVQTQVLECLDGSGTRGGTLTANHLLPPRFRIVQNDRRIASGSVQMRLGDLQDEGGGDRGIKGIAAAFQYRHAGAAGQPVRAGDNSERPGDFRARGEHGGKLQRCFAA